MSVPESPIDPADEPNQNEPSESRIERISAPKPQPDHTSPDTPTRERKRADDSHARVR
jgi:hypothetical protein